MKEIGLPKEKVEELRKELDCKDPIIFFHDDADGLASFLLIYRYLDGGKGIVMKSQPPLGTEFLPTVKSYEPDKIIILDIPTVDQTFFDEAPRPVIWVDHHNPLDRDRVLYFNPRVSNHEDNIPVSALCYEVVQQDLWIATIGAVGDWFWPDFIEDFRNKFPDLLPKEIKDQEQALFHSKLGQLVNILQFCLKGTTRDAMKYVKVFTRIKSPDEIFSQTSSSGKFVWKRYSFLNEFYKKLLEQALDQEPNGKILVFNYPHDKYSFTKDLANELLHKKPDFIIVIAREKDGEIKMSLRSKDYILPPILEKALVGLEGYGGGHEHACGACVKKEVFEDFINSIQSQL